MAISLEVDAIETALWPQGDIRDPLGVWGARLGVTGDASGDLIKVGIVVPADKVGAYLYTCYSAIIAQLTGIISGGRMKSRLLTNWPNIDPIAGVQGYGNVKFLINEGNSGATAPIGGPAFDMIGPNDRFILLFDPRPSAGQITIVELENDSNTLNETWSFEAYGYYWDRSVLNAPGGPRHPGSS